MKNLTCLPAFCLSVLSLALYAGSICPPGNLLAFQETGTEPTWEVTSNEQVGTIIMEWPTLVDETPTGLVDKLHQFLDDEQRNNDQPLDVAAGAIGLLFTNFEPVIASLEQPSMVEDPKRRMAGAIESINRLPAIVQPVAKLVVGRGFVRMELYDEAIELMAELEPDEVLDPAALHFYRALAMHRLVRKDECLESLGRLLQNENQLPRRFAAMGQLMMADFEGVEPDSLDEISRLMQDASRHQSLSRSGSHVLGIEETVLEKLDKLIEEAEKQQEQQQQSANRAVPSSPMDKSRNMPGKGDGQVTDRQIAEGGAWGNLPPRERAAALMEMTRDLPPHYREVIEEYFRQLAKEK